MCIRDSYDPVQLARAYEKGGARAISVLTDTRHFQGTLEPVSYTHLGGLAAAAAAIDGGAALATLENWIAMTNSFRA